MRAGCEGCMMVLVTRPRLRRAGARERAAAGGSERQVKRTGALIGRRRAGCGGACARRPGQRHGSAGSANATPAPLLWR